MDAFSKKTVTAKTSKTAVKDSGSGSSTDGATSKNPVPAKKKKPVKRKPSTSDSEDSGSDFGQRVKKITVSKKSKKMDDAFSVDSDIDSPVAPRERGGRARKPIQYLEESDEEIF